MADTLGDPRANPERWESALREGLKELSVADEEINAELESLDSLVNNLLNGMGEIQHTYTGSSQVVEATNDV